jgi:carbon monoxide dehydrogenase subunit G
MRVQVSGSKEFHTSPADTYRLLTDPDVIVKAMPGLKSMTRRPGSEYNYDADIEVGVAGVKGHYQGEVEMRDVVPAESYTLAVKGEGPMGFMEAEVQIRLAARETGGTTVTYEGEAKVGGTVAGVGQRVLSGVAKLLVGQFFGGVVKVAQQADSAAGSAR